MTIIKNLELYGLDPQSVANVLQQKVQASVTITPIPGTKDRVQVQIQGNQIHHLAKMLLGKLILAPGWDCLQQDTAFNCRPLSIHLSDLWLRCRRIPATSEIHRRPREGSKARPEEVRGKATVGIIKSHYLWNCSANKSRITYRPCPSKRESWMVTGSTIHPKNNIAPVVHSPYQ